MADVPPLPDDDDDDDDLETTDFHRYTRIVHVGEPPSDIPSDWVMTTVYFHGFADLPHERGSFLTSSNFHCLGHEWCLMLFPRGVMAEDDEEDATDEKNVSLYLCHQDNSSIEIEYCFEVRDFCDGTIDMNLSHGVDMFGFPEFIIRETALTYLVKGALVIEVRMKPVNRTTPFVPENPSKHFTVKDLFMDTKSADIVFEIRGDEQEVVGAKRRRNVTTPSSKMYAHSFILSKASPLLAELCKSKRSASPQLIEIHNISSEVFKDMLRYIYGCHIPGFGNDISHTKQIIEMADKYGVVGLKLEAEARFVSSLTLTVENVMEHFHFAEAKNCAYLKEKTLDFIVSSNADIVKQKILSSAVGGPSSSDILVAVAVRSRAENEDDNELCTMSISELRRKAYAKGLDVDGSREMLISALE